MHKYSNQNTSAIQQYRWPIPQEVDDTSVVKATAIADFKMWPTSEEELHTFGDDWMNTLLDQFGSYLDTKITR